MLDNIKFANSDMRAYAPILHPETIFRTVIALWNEAEYVAPMAHTEPEEVHLGKMALEIVQSFGYNSVQEFINAHNGSNDDDGN